MLFLDPLGYLLLKFVPTFLARASGYMGTSNLTGKRIKKAKKAAVFDHLL